MKILEIDGIPIRYINDSLKLRAMQCGIYNSRRGTTSQNPHKSGMISYDISYNSIFMERFANIIEDIDTLTDAMDQGADKYVPGNYKALFNQACNLIARRTNIDAYGIAEIIKQDAKTRYEKDLLSFLKKEREEKQRYVDEAKKREQLKEFLSKADRIMGEFVKELRITFSKAYKPFLAISAIAGLGYFSWFGAQYWIKEKSAQAVLANVRNQNILLKAENGELSRYKDVGDKIQSLTQQVTTLKDENNKIKSQNNKLVQDNEKFNQQNIDLSQRNDNLNDRIYKCNSGFIRIDKC